MELLSAWAPLQPWGSGLSGSALDIVGAYRFDDPEGEVGIETHLLRSAEGQVVQVPVTYRGAPVPEAEAALIATTQHSVLGQRWVYDGCGDPAYVAALATAILTGGTEADLDVVTESGHERRPATTKVTGSGAPGSAVPPVGPLTYRHEGGTTVVRSGALELRIFRVIDLSSTAGIAGVCVLMGTWPGQGTPALLASVPAGPIRAGLSRSQRNQTGQDLFGGAEQSLVHMRIRAVPGFSVYDHAVHTVRSRTVDRGGG